MLIRNLKRPAGMICIAGGAEKAPNAGKAVKRASTSQTNLEGLHYGWRLTQAMPETFSKLKTLKELPVYIVSGGHSDRIAWGDLDEPPEAPLATYNELPNKEIVNYINLSVDHGALSVAPFATDQVDIIEWLFRQRKAECNPVMRFGRSLRFHRVRRLEHSCRGR